MEIISSATTEIRSKGKRVPFFNDVKHKCFCTLTTNNNYNNKNVQNSWKGGIPEPEVSGHEKKPSSTHPFMFHVLALCKSSNY